MERNKFLIFIFTLIVATFSAESFAGKKQNSSKAQANPRIQTSLVVDANSGKILHNKNAYVQVYPASLTKLMTLYVAFDHIKSGNLKLKDDLPVSLNAQNMRPCKLGLVAGQKIKTEEAINALIVKSANDAAVVIAEAVAGNEKNFAVLMNKTAKRLGMSNSNFMNASGWHHPEQKTTAADLAKLTLSIKRNFPEFYPWFSKDSFNFAGKTIRGHNRVTREYPGAEGMKTGFTNPSGFNLVTTASRDGKSLVAVVTGSDSAIGRDSKMMALVDQKLGMITEGGFSG